jgi:hypothetical protein
MAPKAAAKKPAKKVAKGGAKKRVKAKHAVSEGTKAVTKFTSA